MEWRSSELAILGCSATLRCRVISCLTVLTVGHIVLVDVDPALKRTEVAKHGDVGHVLLAAAVPASG